MEKASNIVKTIIIAIIAIFVLIFCFQNLERVPIRFLNQHTIDMPLFIILFGVLLLGVIVGYLIGMISGSKVAKKKIEEIHLKANEKVVEVASEIQAKNTTEETRSDNP